MLAAINRGQDYAKTSRNVALTPTNGTIDVAKTIETAVRCVRHRLSSGSSFNALPIPPTICKLIITDGHWLLENMLCLLSNAGKYSFTGDITMTFELISTGVVPYFLTYPYTPNTTLYILCPIQLSSILLLIHFPYRIMLCNVTLRYVMTAITCRLRTFHSSPCLFGR